MRLKLWQVDKVLLSDLVVYRVNVDIKPEVYIPEPFTWSRSYSKAYYPFNPVLLADFDLDVSRDNYALIFHPRISDDLMLVRYNLDASFVWDTSSQFEGHFSVVSQSTRVTCQ